jgi:hypothetical protein
MGWHGYCNLVSTKSIYKEVIQMKRLLSLLLAGFFTFNLLFAAFSLDASAAVPSNNIVGTVTLVGNNTMKILDDSTGIERDLKISESQEENLTTGYQVELETNNGKVISYMVLGIPENVEQIVYSTRGFDEF